MKPFHIGWHLFFYSFFLVGTAARAADQSTLIKYILEAAQNRYAPDRRTAVFNITYTHTEKNIILTGETDAPHAKSALLDTLRKYLKEEVVDSICVLPDPSLGNSKNGIVLVDVGDVRREPSRHGELLSQGLMGMEVKLLKKAEGYYFIQMPDHYLGWIDTASICMVDQRGLKAWNTAPKVIVTELKGFVSTAADSSSAPLCNVVAGCILKNIGRKNGWIQVERADRRKGFIPNTLVQDLGEWKKSRLLTGENLEKTARMLLGISYLWGGTSVRGMDCSGFVKTVYRLNGLELHRDADQQAEQGTRIDPGKNFENLWKGDLMFFGPHEKGNRLKHITHVGMYLGNRLFIHSSGKVKIGSVDPSSDYFDKSLLNRFVRACRIIRN